MAIPSPAQDQLMRFRQAVELLAGKPRSLGLAVSGGPDSLALLLLANGAFPGQVQVATVDHGLRDQSKVEALQVSDLCARLGCPHSIVAAVVPNGPAGLQAEARTVRYRLLEDWAQERGIGYVATAHHADDQAETLLMRLQRGSGVRGLSGIRPIRPEGGMMVIRPLLAWRRSELVHLVANTGIEAVDDPSNADGRFDRTVMRRFLAANPQFEPKRLARSAAALREADEALDWAAAELAEDRITIGGDEWRVDPTGLPRELARRLLIKAIGTLREAHGLEPHWKGEDVEGLLSALEAGQAGTLAGVMARAGQFWHLRQAPPRRPIAGAGEELGEERSVAPPRD